MKNKIISAMLLGMSATMAVPGTVMAAEENPDSAAQETAAEVPAENEGEDAETGEDQNSDEEQGSEETQNVEEETLKEAVQEMREYATDEDAKIQDTPVSFVPELNSIEFTSDVFGKYADALNEYVNGPDIDMSSIYNCETDMVKKVAELTQDESDEAIAAAKYQVILVFENIYGEDAFMPGRDIRREIIADDSKDEEFAICETISEADAVYINAGGVTTNPVTLFKADEQPTETPEQPTETPEQPTETPEQPTETPEQPTETPEQPTEEKKSLDEYVEGLDDIEIQLGDDLPTPRVTYDNTKIASVSLDTSKVDKNTIGVYTISYIIKGLDGTTKIVNKQCAVSEDPVLKQLRIDMCAKADEMNSGKFTEKEFKNKWDEAVKAAKKEIVKKTSEDEMQVILDNLEKTGSSILNEQQLHITKNGYIGKLYDKVESTTFVTDAQKNMAEAAMKDAVAKIKEAKSVEEAKSALDAGINAIDKIIAQDENSIDSLRKEAKNKIDAAMQGIQDKTTITKNVYGAMIDRLDKCTTAKEIDSVTNSASSAFTHIKKAITGDMSSMSALYKDLKGISTNSDTTATIDKIIATGTPKNVTDGENKVSDICSALTNDVNGFVKYLTGRAGKTVMGKTKVEAYDSYIKLTNGEAKPDENLAAAKKEAKTELEKLLKEIDSEDSSVVEEKSKIQRDTEKSIDEASSESEVKFALSNAKTKITELKNRIANEKGLKAAKEAAKEEVQKVVDEQTDDTLKASAQQLANTAFVNIENATTKDEINSIVNTFKSDVKTAKDVYKNDKELATAKANALSKLSTLESKVKADYVTTEMKNIISTARENIEKAKSADECSRIYSDAKIAYNNAYLTSMRSTYNNKLDALLTDNKFTDDAYVKKAQEVIAKQKANIENAKNEDIMEKCYNLAKESITKLAQAQETATKLAQAKTDAIAKIKAMVTNPTDTSNKIIDTYTEKINAATSEDEINKLVDACQQALKDAGVNANSTEDAAKLAQTRADAISTLQKMLDTVPADKKEDAQKVFDSYVEKINADTTEDAIKKDLEEGKEALKKYGASDVTDNTPTPNGNTSTTLDSSGSGAIEKGSDVASTNGVKTGDNNMSVIAMASAAIMGALAAAVISLKKFIKK